MNIKNIALIGQEATNPTTHGGGSGQVTPGFVASPAFSIRNKFGFPGDEKISFMLLFFRIAALSCSIILSYGLLQICCSSKTAPVKLL